MSQLTFWIVGTESNRARRWETVLNREGWDVSSVGSVETVIAEADQKRLGLALLDWDLMKARTTEAVTRLKLKAAGVSVILTSEPELPADKVIGVLEAGADDHFIVAIDDRLFLAKMRAHLRRILPSLASALDVLKSPSGELKLDRSAQQVWMRGARGRWSPVPGLTRTEFQFLSLFLEQPGKVLERGFILENGWQGGGADVRPGTVDKHIESLRRKLGRFSSMIRTVYGVGYVLQDAQ